ncbi:integrase [Bosea sp. Root381]|uniref:tyrosine-type recombinase/integrase n=1 Tax=Bosea sp. Root381 TaxID=1736524 RepID=UPI0006F2A86F|nr:integrase arm-type DNA-binding domain-containing protein [Bosea sp. Root381]KRE05976.1 integrase [Bosea sp. Root381]
MAKNKLSEARIKGLSKPGLYGDGDGLWLRVHKPKGERPPSKNWIFIFRRGVTRTEIGLGGYGQGTQPVSLALARTKADAIRDRLALGEHPHHSRAKARTFKDVVDDYLEAKSSEWTNAKHAAQWRDTLTNYASDLHALPVAGITMEQVKECLLPHWTARHVTATRLRARIASVFDFAIAHKWRRDANPAAWTGLLEHALPKPQKAAKHHTALPYTRVPDLSRNLRSASGVAARCVEFILLTAVRMGEARGALFSEVDTKARTWTVPASRAKMKKDHVVPLTERGLGIIENMRQQSVNEFIFPGAVEGKPISETAVGNALDAATPAPATPHGLRSTLRDWAGDCTSHPREIIEAALAHQVGNAVERAYRRSDALQKRRALMEDWAKYCDQAQ